MADKDWPAIVKIIAPIARTILACSPKTERACPSKNIAREAEKFISDVVDCKSVKGAVYKAVDKAGAEDVICVTGSFYLVSEAKRHFAKVYG
jgi:dihydrofolate synthase/folylpolyglutamate synthase